MNPALLGLLDQTVIELNCQTIVIMMPSTGDFRKLDGMNYVEWAGMMEAWLVKKRVWGIVSGDETSPIGGENVKPVKAFLRHQTKACAEIILHVNELQLAYV
jgi:hypothetical protein